MEIKLNFFKINHWLERNRIVTLLLLFLIVLVYFSWLQNSPYFADPDSFYHLKMAQLMAQKGVIHDFPYLNFTVLKDNYIDHHFLYHLYLVPFITYLPAVVGVKLAQVILDSCLILVFFWLLNKLKVRGAIWYSLLLLVCEAFVFRIGLVKAQPLSIMVLFLGVYFIIRQKYWFLSVLAFIYVWAYDGWFLLLILGLAYILVTSLEAAGREPHGFINKIKAHFYSPGHKLVAYLKSFLKNLISPPSRKTLAAIILGLAAGIVVNPYFPQNLNFYWVHIVQIGLVNFQNKIGVGAEWYPYSLTQFLTNTYLPLVITIGALILFLNYLRGFDKVVKYLFLLFLLFLVVTIKARRNIEYLVPFMILFAATVYSRVMAIGAAKNELHKLKNVLMAIMFRNRWVRLFSVAIIISVLLVLVYYLPTKAKDDLSRGYHFNYLKDASDFLKKNSQAGDVVFHSDWDIFPPLFYHNSQNYYLVGLDTTFMYLYNKNFYHEWVDVTNGKQADKAYSIIKNDFQAKYVLVTPLHGKMIELLNNNFHFVKVYVDKDAIIYKVL